MLSVFGCILITISVLNAVKNLNNDNFCESLMTKKSDLIVNYVTHQINNETFSKIESEIDYYMFFKTEYENIKIKFFFFKKLCIITENLNCIFVEDKHSNNYRDYIFLDPKKRGLCENHDHFFSWSTLIAVVFCHFYLEDNFSKFLYSFGLMGICFISYIFSIIA